MKNILKIVSTIGLSIFLFACSTDDDDGSRVVVSSSNIIIDLVDLQYRLPFVVQVADLNGSPQPNTTVSIALTPIGYLKGDHAPIDTDGDMMDDEWGQIINDICAAEVDINNNGIFEISEDINGNGLKDPKTPLISEHPSLEPTLIPGTSTLLTNNEGFGYFTVTYPQSQGRWVTVRLTATAADSLPENRDIVDFTLRVAKSDAEDLDIDPAFKNSPYGTQANCTTTARLYQ